VDLSRIVNSDLGGRQAGSRADAKVCTYLEGEMRRIGLKNVRKEAFPVDTWQFNGSVLSVIEAQPSEPADRNIHPYSYASGATPPEGIDAELVYV